MVLNMKLTIENLKKHLGPGLGLRKNKYLLEIPMPGLDGAKVNVLARSAGLPERNISTSSVFHKGRKYIVRGETDYIGTYEVSIVDDSNMDIRRKFDDWLKLIDDSKPANSGLFSAGSYETGIGAALNVLNSGINQVKNIKTALKDPMGTIGGFVLGAIDPGLASASAKYQTDINIWQLSGTGSKVYGYKIENAFPSQIGIVTLDDGNPNTLSEFSVTFSFSEFIPLDGTTVPQQVLSALVGDKGTNAVKGFKSF